MITAIYDGNCVICNQTRRLVRLLDWFQRIEFLNLHQQDEVNRRYPQVEYNAAMGQVHVMTPDGKMYAGFYGTRRMMRELPLLMPLWALLSLPGMDRIGVRVYNWIARNRYRINQMLGVQACSDTCRIPQ